MNASEKTNEELVKKLQQEIEELTNQVKQDTEDLDRMKEKKKNYTKENIKLS